MFEKSDLRSNLSEASAAEASAAEAIATPSP